MNCNLDISLDNLTPLQKQIQLNILAKRKALGDCMCCFIKTPGSYRRNCHPRNKKGICLCFVDNGECGTFESCGCTNKKLSQSYVKEHEPKILPIPPCNDIICPTPPKCKKRKKHIVGDDDLSLIFDNFNPYPIRVIDCCKK